MFRYLSEMTLLHHHEALPVASLAAGPCHLLEQLVNTDIHEYSILFSCIKPLV